MTLFTGPKASDTDIGSIKEGPYVTAGKGGVRDVGGKSEIKTSTQVGPIFLNHQVAGEVASLVAGPDAGTPPSSLAEFGGGR
jgi:hypothetical protein